MQRAQILFDPQLKKELDRVSRRTRLSISSLVRQAVRAHLNDFNNTQVGLDGLVTLGDQATHDKAPRDVSKRVDEILYPL